MATPPTPPAVTPGTLFAAMAATSWALVPITLGVGVGDLLSVDALIVLWVAACWPAGRRVAWGLFCIVLSWELVRAVGASLMDQDPLLYDLFHLLRHVAVLGADLLGMWLLPATLGALLAAGVGVVAGVWLLDRGHGVPAKGVAAVLAIAVLTWALGGPARFSAAAFAGNVVESIQVRSEVAQMVAMPAYDVYDGLLLPDGPDLHIYVVESYGRILLRRRGARERWLADTPRRTTALQDAGFHLVSAYATAPVSGGRSWLADATMLTGRHVAHESVFNEVMAKADDLVHLPGVLARAGYETVLVRPKDRARAGVELRNDYRFSTPVFYEDLTYTGPAIGWGWIPDQYTLGWLRQHTLHQPEGPQFVFAHLVSSHAPWLDVPEHVASWESLGAAGVAPAEGQEDHGMLEELLVQLGRYQRRSGHRGQRRATADHMERYGGSVAYDLDVLVEHLVELPERPGVYLLLGDHQPPLVAKSEDFDVPIHVVSRDPALLEPFEDVGFQEGWELAPDAPAVMKLEGLQSLLLHTIAPAHELPVWVNGP